MARNIDARTQILVLLALKKHLTATELQQMIGTTSGTIAVTIKKLRAEKLVYISDWKRSYRTKGRMGARYSLGDHFDAAQPPPNRKADNKRYQKSLNPTLKRLRVAKNHKTLSIWTPLRKSG